VETSTQLTEPKHLQAFVYLPGIDRIAVSSQSGKGMIETLGARPHRTLARQSDMVPL
jgi:hypothetical protein